MKKKYEFDECVEDFEEKKDIAITAFMNIANMKLSDFNDDKWYWFEKSMQTAYQTLKEIKKDQTHETI